MRIGCQKHFLAYRYLLAYEKQEISEVNLAYEVGRKCPEDDSVCGRRAA